jgi:inositol-pentakisphosphate 2-kinase
VSILLRILIEHPVLRTLSDLQRTLDPLDIEGLSRLCSDSQIDNYPLTPLPLPTGSTIADPDLKEWSSFLDFVSQDTLLNHIHPDKSNQRYYLMAYLLSATFKDCSVIIRPHGDDAKSAAVTIIDLDAKSLTRLERWEALDRRVLIASMADDRVCVDSRRNS